MLMPVKKTKRMAMLGVMAALSTVLLVLGTVISMNTLFFTAAAAFFAGAAVVMYGAGYGVLFYLVCGSLDFFLNPDKMHVFLYLALAGYVLLSEMIWSKMNRVPDGKKKEWMHRGIRFLLFAVMYLPLVLLVPRLLVPVEWIRRSWFLPLMCLGGAVAWFLFDLAYTACKRTVLAHMVNNNS